MHGLPEFQFDQSFLPKSPRPRPWVWPLVFAVFASLVAMTLAMIMVSSSSQGFTEDRRDLRRVLAKFDTEMEAPNPFEDTSEPDKEMLTRARREVQELKLTTKGAKAARDRALLIIEQELQPTKKPDFSKLVVATDDITDPESRRSAELDLKELHTALKEIYTAKSLNVDRADELRNTITDLTGLRFPYNLVESRIDALSSRKAAFDERKGVATVIFAFLVLAGIGAWVLFAVLSLGGQKPAGVPLIGTAGDGDELGIRLLAFLAAFVALPMFIMLPLQFLGVDYDPWAEVLLELLLLASLAIILTMAIAGRRRTLAEIGLRSTHWAKDVAYGVGGFLANWPIMIVTIFIGREFFGWIPSGEHPIQQEILRESSRLPLFLSAVLFAPIIEEPVFRGLFFQGFFLRYRNVVMAVLVSSVFFAAIHPQGGVLWPTLGWIGAMGAMLTYWRGSLVPAIVMHLCHNGTLMAVSIYLS